MPDMTCFSNCGWEVNPPYTLFPCKQALAQLVVKIAQQPAIINVIEL